MKTIVVLSSAVLLAACAQPRTYDQGVASAVSAGSGALIGVTVGGLMGSGNGNVAMMVVGGMVGAMGGWAYGSTLMPSDRETLRATTKQAMAHARDGEVVSWANPETRVAGTVTPTRSFVGRYGASCRTFEASIAAREGVGRGTGAACLAGDGEWQIFGLDDRSV